MGISIDNSIRLLEDYHKWEKQFGMDGSGVDDATKELIEVAKKYEKIEQIRHRVKHTDLEPAKAYELINEVVEDGNND